MKISIVIPSRERGKYLEYSLQTALEIDDPDIEVLVSDNASSDNTAEIVARFDDPRLVYVNTGARVSMRENFNRAFLASTGDYLIYFGDDDGILPKQFPMLRSLLEKHQPDGISWERMTYGWPVKGFGKKTGGVRTFKSRSYGSVTAYDGAQRRENLLACRLHEMQPLPELYHGCFSRDYLIRTATRPDLIFDSAIPDFNIAYRAVLKGGRFLHVEHPFSINGHSPASTGGGHSAGQSKTGDTGTSTVFEAENKIDPVTDVVGHASSVPLAFFSTIETVRERHGLQNLKPEYQAWYRYVLSSGRKNPNLKAQLVEILAKRASETGSEAALQAAIAMPPQPKRTWGEKLSRWRDTARSVRMSGELDGENTILSTAHVLDVILGDDFAVVLAGKKSKTDAWSGAIKRSKQFKREL